jgi:hypothetical protein
MKPAHWLLPYDLYERHHVVARLIAAHGQRDARVLDVGGRSGLLARFISCRVMSVNVDGSGDVSCDGGYLPFVEGAFDVVTAIDTLEHLPRHRRLDFVRECLRVSAKVTILAAPFGSPEHAESEARLNRLYTALHGAPHRYLSEHVQHGLPDLSELQALIAGSGVSSWRLLFAGDYRREAAHFAAAARATALACRGGGAPARLAGLWAYARSRAIFNRLCLSESPLPHTNRFYLQLSKAGAAPPASGASSA